MLPLAEWPAACDIHGIGNDRSGSGGYGGLDDDHMGYGRASRMDEEDEKKGGVKLKVDENVAGGGRLMSGSE